MKSKTPSPKIFTQESAETPKHDEMLILFSEKGDFLKKIVFEEFFKILGTSANPKTIQINKWFPEKEIINKGYYIGSVDLYVETRVEYQYSGERKTQTKTEDMDIVFEFKPQIKSFSEVLRQVNVYNNYFPRAKFIVVTYSDIEKFKDCFESQGISIIKLETPSLK